MSAGATFVANRGKMVSNAEFKRLWLDRSNTVAEIGSMLGISGSAVTCRAIIRGLGPRDCGPLPSISDDVQFRAMWIARVAMCEIARELGVHVNTVRNHAIRLGLKRRSGGRSTAISMAQFRHQQAVARLAETAQAERAQWALAEMIDGRASSGRWAA